MPLTFSEFSHHGDHLVNDDRQANMTISLLAAFVIALSFITLLLFGP